jgi:hopene-associated glycosyltransferase HpnB
MPCDDDSAPDPAAWPSVAIVVPARNEGSMLPRTLPALQKQDYPGAFRVIVVDDRSTDDTSKYATLAGAALPEGWVGKVWAMHQGVRLATEEYVLFTDADILHAPDSLRRLVAESMRDNLSLNSRMARLRCESFAEKLLIPPYVWFFNLLYPMRRVNEGRLAAAAGGCMLVKRSEVNLETIKDAVIDDMSLARTIQGRQRLALSRDRVVSLREYQSIGPIWRMVRRTAFTELRHSWLRVFACLVMLTLLFAAPLVVWIEPALAAWMVMALAYSPAPRFFGLNPLWAAALPFAGLLYGAMTLDSALRGKRTVW